MTGIKRCIQTLLVGIITILFTFCVTILAIDYFTISVNERNNVVCLDQISQTGTLTLGDACEVFSSSTLCHQPYIELLLGANDTYQIEFYRQDKLSVMIADSGVWAVNANIDGDKPIVLLIPDYISKRGYDRIQARPIRGDGDFCVKSFRTMGSKEETQYENINLIDYEIKQLEINIDDEDYAKIEAKRSEAIDLGILLSEEEDMVPANIKSSGETYKADVRLKGDWTDHLLSDQWSLRINLKGDNCIYGMQKFSIQTKDARNGIWEYLIYEMYRDQGGVALRYDFADVFINGIYKGVYAVEEFMEKRVIENSKKREGPILRIFEDMQWENWAYTTDVMSSVKDTDLRVDVVDVSPRIKAKATKAVPAGVQYSVGVFSEGKTIRSQTLSGYAAYAVTQMNRYLQGTAPVDEVFDIDLFARLHAILDVFASSHGRVWHNERNYFNPVTALLEPIPFDEQAFYDMNVYLPQKEYLFEKDMFENEEHNQIYIGEIRRLIANWPDIWEKYDDNVKKFAKTILRDDYSFEVPQMTDLDKRREALGKMFDIEVDFALKVIPGTDNVELSVKNRGTLDVTITATGDNKEQVNFATVGNERFESIFIPAGVSATLYCDNTAGYSQFSFHVTNFAAEKDVAMAIGSGDSASPALTDPGVQ